MTEDLARFAERYAVSGEAAGLAAEYEALGTDYQANGYTTRDQADELGGRWVWSVVTCCWISARAAAGPACTSPPDTAAR